MIADGTISAFLHSINRIVGGDVASRKRAVPTRDLLSLAFCEGSGRTLVDSVTHLHNGTAALCSGSYSHACRLSPGELRRLAATIEAAPSKSDRLRGIIGLAKNLIAVLISPGSVSSDDKKLLAIEFGKFLAQIFSQLTNRDRAELINFTREKIVERYFRETGSDDDLAKLLILFRRLTQTSTRSIFGQFEAVSRDSEEATLFEKIKGRKITKQQMKLVIPTYNQSEDLGDMRMEKEFLEALDPFLAKDSIAACARTIKATDNKTQRLDQLTPIYLPLIQTLPKAEQSALMVFVDGLEHGRGELNQAIIGRLVSKGFLVKTQRGQYQITQADRDFFAWCLLRFATRQQRRPG